MEGFSCTHTHLVQPSSFVLVYNAGLKLQKDEHGRRDNTRTAE